MKKLLVATFGILLIVILFILLNPQARTDQRDQSERQKVATGPVVRAFSLEIQNNELVSSPRTLRVNQGDEVNIRIVSDASDELHLHGYDKEVELAAGEPVEISFTADAAGRFEAELHHAEKTVFALEVQPR